MKDLINDPNSLPPKLKSMAEGQGRTSQTCCGRHCSHCRPRRSGRAAAWGWGGRGLVTFIELLANLPCGVGIIPGGPSGGKTFFNMLITTMAEGQNSLQKATFFELLANLPCGVGIIPGGPGGGKTFFNMLIIAMAQAGMIEFVDEDGNKKQRRPKILYLLDINRPVGINRPLFANLPCGVGIIPGGPGGGKTFFNMLITAMAQAGMIEFVDEDGNKKQRRLKIPMSTQMRRGPGLDFKPGNGADIIFNPTPRHLAANFECCAEYGRYRSPARASLQLRTLHTFSLGAPLLAIAWDPPRACAPDCFTPHVVPRASDCSAVCKFGRLGDWSLRAGGQVLPGGAWGGRHRTRPESLLRSKIKPPLARSFSSLQSRHPPPFAHNNILAQSELAAASRSVHPSSLVHRSAIRPVYRRAIRLSSTGAPSVARPLARHPQPALPRARRGADGESAKSQGPPKDGGIKDSKMNDFERYIDTEKGWT
ncbi:hypothetical protein GGTG_04708 [Gaeumannomyces tritici R3-111a-1]|uniref:Uncharacterized protein n=1 Tax=Gaeumannomyces tritici (strain R3-111a-1) TaxID=644352 RepID=J3NTV9_GAET3|nr:hypothetical protein GGTG_04708 [Gaeumannomyces tritici R3-111a-1]EJT79624.1 hypothetical protein GGTG_04708 [Gaeumannomyces tritici R3-111a-1]